MSDSGYKQFRDLKESLRSQTYKQLEQIFSESEAFFLNHFCRSGEYGKADVQPYSLEYVRSVLKIMDFFVQLKNLDYYRESLAFKKRELDSKKSRF